MTGFAGLVGPGWAEALAPVAEDVAALGDFLRGEVAAGRRFLPAGDRVFAALAGPLEDVRVVIVGQDPYPTPGHATGLSFSVGADVRPLPPSLANIFTEYATDLGVAAPRSGDLSAWSAQGVLLLNRVLTVQVGRPGSHRGKGWERVTEQVLRALAARSAPLVGVLWGADARKAGPLLAGAPTVSSPHPSPLSAHRGFFGSRPFSRVNALLAEQGAEPIDWRLP